ncbi:MAG: DUF4302 domain-containing protein [Bacteroidales bacterium]|nr:DUF4302 domain-containing protein [Bacteroidales bacterium]
MKRIIYLAFLFFTLAACHYEEPDIFSAAPAERLTTAMKEDAIALQSASNGWAMEYFATPSSPGYTLFAKFKPSGEVFMSCKNELTNNVLLSDSSVYTMIGDYGPVLSFASFNKVMHQFSNPENPNGYGLEGDYEFIVLKTSANQITLQGKKRGTIIMMNKIPQNKTWNEYITDLETMNTTLFGFGAPSLTMSITEKYNFSGGGSHIFTILQSGADVNTSIDAPFIVTPTGIRFHTIQELDGKSFQTFTLNTDKSALICTENPDLKFVGPDSLSSFLEKNLNIWNVDPTKLSASVQSTYDLLVQSLVTKYKATGIKLFIKYNSVRKSHVLAIQFTSGKNKLEGDLDMNFNIGGKAEISMMNTENADSNGAKFYTNIAGYKEMADLLSTSFTLTTDSPINPQVIRLVKKSDANTWLTITTNTL